LPKRWSQQALPRMRKGVRPPPRKLRRPNLTDYECPPKIS
jgi:hypothetical protein